MKDVASDYNFQLPDCYDEDCILFDESYYITRDTVIGTNSNQNIIYTVTIDFLHENNSKSFNVRGNGTDYGYYDYDDLPIVMGPFECDDESQREFVIRDSINQDCKLVIIPDKVPCPDPDSNEDYNIAKGWNISYLSSEKSIYIFNDNEVTENAKIQVFDELGRNIMEKRIDDGQRYILIPTANIREGLYITRFYNQNKSYSKKIIL
ncbi:MAG: T9SS type A sorting domain-containing protein [Saprospiraceae bacterium]